MSKRNHLVALAITLTLLAYLVHGTIHALMTKTVKSKAIVVLSIVAIASLVITSGQVYGAIYGYQAIKPSGSFSEVVAVKGDIFPYKGGISGANQHVDRIVYLTDTLDFSVGVGYYDYTDASSVERYRTFRYWDNGALEDNFHLLTGTDPSTWFTAEVVQTSSTTYDFKINGASIGTRSCSSACPNPTIAGSAAWGTGTTSNMNVNANFNNLALKRNTDSSYQTFQNVANLKKCQESPSTIGFEYPLSGNSINQLIVDATTLHECTGDVSSVWLYNHGGG